MSIHSHVDSDAVALTLENPACSFWLRDALTQALDRDPVDALADAEQLVSLLRNRLSAIASEHEAAQTHSE